MYKSYRGNRVVGNDRDLEYDLWWLRNHENSVSHFSLSIVIVPGVATLPPEAWSDSTGSWLRVLLTSTGPRTQVWIYNYTILQSSTSFMQKILNEGNDLLTCLTDLPRTVRGELLFHCPDLALSIWHTQAQRIPLLFICHSLGGLIVKKVRISRFHIALG